MAVNVFPDPEYDPYLTGKSPRAPLTGAIHPMASSKATFINTAIDAARSLMARRLPRKARWGLTYLSLQLENIWKENIYKKFSKFDNEHVMSYVP